MSVKKKFIDWILSIEDGTPEELIVLNNSDIFSSLICTIYEIFQEKSSDIVYFKDE